MSEAAQPTDEELMAAYVGGDATAFRRLFARHAPTLLRVMRQNLGSEADAQDVVQNTFLNLHRARADYRAGARLKPWLYTIAYNLMRDLYRRRRRRPEDPVEPHTQDRHDATGKAATPPAPDARLQHAGLHAALRGLPDNQREVIVLHWFEGFSFPEIADIVGAKVSAVKVRAHRGYKRLRAQLGETVPPEVTVGGAQA